MVRNQKGLISFVAVAIAVVIMVIIFAAVLGLAGKNILHLNTKAAVSGDPSLVGQWDQPFTTPIVGIHAVLFRTGKVLLIQGSESSDRMGRAFLWDPSNTSGGPNGTFVEKPPPTNLFCSGHSVLADGRVLFAGGHNHASHKGFKDANGFDPLTESWVPLSSMAYARWYPSAITLADGKILTVSGDSTIQSRADTPEAYNPTSNVWQQLTSATRHLPLYPWMFVLPSGKIFNAGPNGDTEVLDIATGQWGPAMNTKAGDRGQFDAPAAAYEPGKILLAGGNIGGNSIATAETIDLSGSDTGVWQLVQPMNFARTHNNMTLLPDGKVLVTGGGVLPAEIFDPATATWSVMASAQINRAYHSTAFLLPDGRVVTTGNNSETRFEIYSPPYLFKGTRPSISSVPGTLAYGSSFNLGFTTPAGTTISKVVLIRPSAVTHSFNMNQRYVPLNFTVSGGTLSIQAPSSANLAPPGDYMLFVVNSQGVPSVAPFVHL